LRNNLITFKNTFTKAFIPAPKANDNRQDETERGTQEVVLWGGRLEKVGRVKEWAEKAEGQKAFSQRESADEQEQW